MLPKVRTQVLGLEKYKNLISEGELVKIKRLARELKGLRVNIVNSTPRGGGVSEILKSLVPLMKGVGIKAEWYTIPPQEDFFKITKEIHNALQGKTYGFPFLHRKRYINHTERIAELMQDMKADIWVINDPQPAGVIEFLPRFHSSICHLHIDLTSPNLEVWKFLAGFLEIYDKVIVSSKDFIKPETQEKTIVFPPAIDPFTLKNQALSLKVAKQVLKGVGINSENPLISQVSRFDPWKDPRGVIKAYQIAKKRIPSLQLVLAGFFLARDDPEAESVYRQAKRVDEKDSDMFIFAEPHLLGSLKIDTFVNAVQVASDVILQNSIREGFGLSITEAMWKGRVVIARNSAGARTQIKNGQNGFLVSNVEEMAEKIVWAIENPKLTEEIGRKAHLTVKEKFLMPRLLRDYLKAFKQLVSTPKKKTIQQENEEVLGTLASY